MPCSLLDTEAGERFSELHRVIPVSFVFLGSKCSTLRVVCLLYS
jgi:hypothetical protein